VWTENDGIFGSLDGGCAHAELVKLIQLFPFAGLPSFPGRQLLELATCKATKCLFFGCDGTWLNRICVDSNLIVADIAIMEVNVGVPDSGDGADIGERQSGDVILVGGVVGLEDVAFMFNERLAELSGTEFSFRSELNVEFFDLFVEEPFEDANSISLRKDAFTIDADDAGTLDLVASRSRG